MSDCRMDARSQEIRQLYRRVLSLWPSTVRIDDVVAQENGGTYFSSLSQAHLAAHETLRSEEDDNALDLNWAVFKLLHRRARGATAEGLRELEVTSLDEDAVLKAYESAARRQLEHGRERPPAE